MTSWLLASLALLTVPSLPLLVTLFGARPEVVLAAPLCGALLAGTAGILTLLAANTLFWYCVLAAGLNLGLVAVILRRKTGAKRPRPTRPWPSQLIWTILTIGVLVIAAAAPIIGPLRDAKYVEWDARSIYMLHARWLFAGHDYLLAAMANPAFAFSHAEYPPLLPSTIAVVWQLGGHVDLRLGELVTTALNLASCSLLGCAVAGVLGRHLRVLGIAAGGVIAAAAMGIAGAGGIDGYADLLAAVPVAAAAVYGLVHPRSRHALSLCVIALLVSALTKDEGLVAGGIVLVLVLVRYWTLVPPRRIERSMIALGVGGAIALMAAWPVAARIVGVPSELQTGAVAPFLSTATPISRVGPTVSALASYWVFLPWVAATSIAALLALRAGRARLSLGGSVWLWLVIVLAGGSLAITYIVGPYDISWWLRTSVDRTTMFVQVLLLSEVIVCGLVAVSCGAAAIGSWRHRAGAA